MASRDHAQTTTARRFAPALASALLVSGCGAPIEQPVYQQTAPGVDPRYGSMSPAPEVMAQVARRKHLATNEIVMDDGRGNVVTRRCDQHGRAVYVVDGFRSTAVSVVNGAPECSRDEPEAVPN